MRGKKAQLRHPKGPDTLLDPVSQALGGQRGTLVHGPKVHKQLVRTPEASCAVQVTSHCSNRAETTETLLLS